MAKNHGLRKYQWEEWLKAGKTKLEKGKDYDCDSWSMAQQTRNWAGRLGYSVEIKEWNKNGKTGLTIIATGGNRAAS